MVLPYFSALVATYQLIRNANAVYKHFTSDSKEAYLGTETVYLRKNKRNGTEKTRNVNKCIHLSS